MGKGGTTNTQPTIPPELQPLYRGSVRNVLGQQQQAPLGGFNERYPEEVAPLSGLERESIGQSYGLFDPSALDAMALRDMLSLPDLYAAGPTTGEYAGSELDLSQFMNLLGGPQYGQIGQEYPPGGPFGPEPGPAAPPPTVPGPPGGNPDRPDVPILQPDQGGPGTLGSTGGITPEQFMASQGKVAPTIPTGGGLQSMNYQGVAAQDRMPIVQPTRERPPTTTIPFRPPTKDDINSNLSDTLGGLAKPPVDPYQKAIGTVESAGTGQLSAATPFGQSPGVLGGYARVSGDAVRNDPAVAAALDEFQKLTLPGIQNEYTLSGLGRSTAVPSAISLGQASMLTPLMQDALGREQHRLDRGYGATEEELGRRERSSVRRADATSQRIGQLMGLSAQQYGQRQGAIQTGLQAGGTQRGVAQQGLSNQYTDFLRRQGLSEQALYAPFGSTGTAGIGSMVRQAK
jgi:hypothetical protein